MEADGLEPASLPLGQRSRHAGDERGAVRVLLGALVALVVALTFGAVAFQSHRSEKEVPASAPVSPRASSAAGDPLPSRVQLLDSDQIRRLGDTQEWRVERTSDNTSG